MSVAMGHFNKCRKFHRACERQPKKEKALSVRTKAKASSTKGLPGKKQTLSTKQMTQATEKKSIAELMDGDKPGMLNLLLEHLLAPASPWRYMEPTASLWGQYEHLTLQDFKEDWEWMKNDMCSSNTMGICGLTRM